MASVAAKFTTSSGSTDERKAAVVMSTTAAHSRHRAGPSAGASQFILHNVSGKGSSTGTGCDRFYRYLQYFASRPLFIAATQLVPYLSGVGSGCFLNTLLVRKSRR